MKTQNRFFTGIIMSLLLACTTVRANPGHFLSDTVILKFRNNVDIVVVTETEDDLEAALSYDLNEILEDLKYKVRLEEDESMTLVVEDDFGDRYLKDTTIVLESRIREEEEDDDEEAYEERRKERERRYRRRTRNYYNIDIGMNNYLEDGSFPDESNALYTVRPWGSWYLGFATLFKTNVLGPLYLEWGGGIDWYSFKFENSRTLITKTDQGLVFSTDARTGIDPIKSKLSAAYLHARFIPVFDFSGSRSRSRDRLWNENIGNGFRIGFGPYAAYRIDSWTKNVYKEEGDKERQRERSNFYLNNFRYGGRLQIGWKGIDMFVNYDVSELFTDSKDTPKLNAFTFGFTL